MKWCLVLVVLASCGDPIVSGAYRGEPLYTISGWVELSVSPDDLLGPADEDPPELRVALLWSQTKGSSFVLDGAREQEVVTTGEFPARFDVTIYEPPEDAVLRDVTDGSGRVAIGALVAYVDSDGDEHWDRETEDLVGGAADQLFLYTPDGVTSSLFGDLGPGFHGLVPTSACDGAGISQSASVRYDSDLSDSVTLGVDGQFPMSALFDVDCDSQTFDWGGFCPPLDQVGATCRDQDRLDGKDQTMCQICATQACPRDYQGDYPSCQTYFLECIDQGNPDFECLNQFYWCTGDQPPPPPRGQHGNLPQSCEDGYQHCLEHDTEAHCQELRSHCNQH